jgi:CPA2 family monovalent cation:H+ antiporter-2
MVVGQSPVSQQAAADALPLRDAFAVLFFASVGMLFDPRFIVHHPGMTLACLGIVLIGKPLAAMVIVAVVGYSARTALTVALGLAQIGEFSFILSELGRQHGLVGETEHSVLVACAIVSISINPILFRSMGKIESLLMRSPALWKFLNRKAQKREMMVNAQAGELLTKSEAPLAVVVGFGPVGRAVDSVLRGGGLDTVVVDLNMDTVQSLTRASRAGIYGDATNIEVLHQALPRATHLVITLPHSTNRNPLIVAAKLINPAMRIFVRARHIAERGELMQAGADKAVYEEAEASVALARLVLDDRGASDETIRREVTRIRRELTAG